MIERTEPYGDALRRTLTTLEGRIQRSEVTVMEGNASDLRASPPEVIVYDPSVPSHRSTGHPLLITALCADRGQWPHIQAAFEAEGFEPLSPVPGPGRVCFASRTQALLIVPAHPGASRAVDQTGEPLMTTIIR
jgi:hypothetical protein